MDQVKEFFLWCTVINVSLLFISFFCFKIFHDFIYKIHSKFYNISVEKFDLIMYKFTGFYKIIVLVFNLVPYIVLEIIA